MKIDTRFAALVQHQEFDIQLGGLIGLLIGDAMGVIWEFQPPEQLPARKLIEMTPPVGFRRSHVGVPPGTWSDDGAQALSLLSSLIEKDKFSLVDFSAKLLQWLDHGYMAVDGVVFDVGNQTEQALNKLRDGVSPHATGGATVLDNGNGSLMRVLPLALWHQGGDESLVVDAHLQSLPTHAHARSLVACAYYCLVARGYMQQLDDPWIWADQRLQDIYAGWPDLSQRKALLIELNVLGNFPKSDTPRGTGYVIDTIWSARRALEEKSFEDVVRAAILFGNDTDTTCATAAGLAGIRFGISGIPQRWLKQLRGFDLAAPLINQYLDRMRERPRKRNDGT